MIHLKDFWRTIRRTLTVFILGTTVAVFTCQAINPPFVIKHLGDGQSIVQIDEQKKFCCCRWKRLLRRQNCI